MIETDPGGFHADLVIVAVVDRMQYDPMKISGQTWGV